MRTSAWTDSVSVIDRLTAVFDAFDERGEGLGVTELARRANLPKSTVSRIAADLVAQCFLERDGDKLYLGIRLFELAQTVEQPRRLRRLAVPVLTELREVTGQTVHLAVLEGSEIVCIAILRGHHASEPPLTMGGRLPAHATALGKAILAFSPGVLVQRAIQGGLEARTPHTICEPSALLRELTGIRRLGVATELEECVPDRACVASPILSHGGAAIAAVSVAGRPADLVAGSVTPAVRAAAIALSRRVVEEGHAHPEGNGPVAHENGAGTPSRPPR
ncbi:MAG: IclR family transcriptional regulator [Microbacterium sp.]|jgi:DNA-binding IclR family transcriptional regulator|nr:IclR family transcriptional regulator [Microbacterium sp.]